MSSKTDEKRLEFAKWVGEYLEHGVIPWQSPSMPSAAPENAVSGRSYKGVNALYLLKPIREEAFTDSRWITVKDANSQGYKVKAGTKGTSVEYWGTRGDKIGSHSYSVFNVEQLESFPAREPDIRPNYDRAAAILKKGGADVPQNRDENAYRAALEKTLADAGKNTPVFNDVHTQDLKALRLTLANTFLMWETHIRTTQDITKATTQSWATSIKHNPAELFRAVRDAGKLVNEMLKGLDLEHEQPNAPEREPMPRNEAAEKKGTRAITPKVGDRVRFFAKNDGPSLTGEVVEMDDLKGTVTLRCGSKSIPVFRGKGSFTEAPSLEREQTKEYAKELARKHVGENGKVFFARDDGVYRGVIVETTPTFAIQKIQEGTAVLHRLKDLGPENGEQIQKGRDVAIHKEAGRITVSPSQVQREQQKKAGVER